MPDINEGDELDKKPRGKKKDISDAALEMLALMSDEEVLLISSGTLTVGRRLFSALKPATMARLRDLPFLLNDAVVNTLYRRGYIVAANKEVVERRLVKCAGNLGMEPIKDTHLSWHSIPYIITDAGKAALEEMRGRLSEIRDSRERRKITQRYVAAARYDYSRRLPGAGNIYAIVRETESRVYIEDAHHPVIDAEREARRNRGFSDSYDASVKGHGLNRWIERGDVIAIDLPPERWVAMRHATRNFDASLAANGAQEDEELAPIKRRYAQRREQLLAELEDGLQGANSSIPVT
jgi:hypothetical protein